MECKTETVHGKTSKTKLAYNSSNPTLLEENKQTKKTPKDYLMSLTGIAPTLTKSHEQLETLQCVGMVCFVQLHSLQIGKAADRQPF